MNQSRIKSKQGHFTGLSLHLLIRSSLSLEVVVVVFLTRPFFIRHSSTNENLFTHISSFLLLRLFVMEENGMSVEKVVVDQNERNEHEKFLRIAIRVRRKSFRKSLIDVRFSSQKKMFNRASVDLLVVSFDCREEMTLFFSL